MTLIIWPASPVSQQKWTIQRVIYCQPLARNNAWSNSFASSNVIGRERAVIDPLPDLPPFDVHKWGRENI
jgi:hypothetical protein